MSQTLRRQFRVFATLQIAVISLTLFSGALSYWIPYVSSHKHIFGLIRYFDVGRESNFPTYISSVNLLIAAVLCCLIYLFSRFQHAFASRYWILLAAIFVFLSIDEATMIHERFEGLRGFFPEWQVVPSRHSWLFAGVAVALILGGSMLPFLFALPRKLAISFVVGGALFAFGVIGMEFVGSLMLNHGFSPDGPAYQIRRLLEEACEMFGIVIFNIAAASELTEKLTKFNLVYLDEGSSGRDG
jgi:hypothetical protein